MTTPNVPKPPPRYEAHYRFPSQGKRWNPLGLFATEREATTASGAADSSRG